LRELRPALLIIKSRASTRKGRRGRVNNLRKEGANYKGPRAIQVIKIIELTKPTESSGRRLWRWERGPLYIAAGNAVLDYDFSGGRRSRQGTADGQHARGPARLILVFQPPKNSDLTSQSEEKVADFSTQEH
jgi:hypothetical protein